MRRIDSRKTIRRVKQMEHDTKHKLAKASKENYWKPAAIVIGLLLLISAYYNLRPDEDSRACPLDTAGTSSLDAVADKALTVLNANLAAQGVQAELLDKKTANGLYLLKLDVAGQQVETYATTDGKLLFTGALELDSPPPAPAPAPSQQSGSEVDMEALMDDDAVEGDPDAPVTIVEFSDYECPFCARFYSQTLGQIREEYVETGKVKIVFRDYPLPFHSQAQKAAEAAECAGEQDKYYEMHDKLFEDGVTGGVKAFKRYAEDIGLDTAEFDECLDSGRMAAEVQKDMAEGSAAGVQGTPAFFVNGQFISGAQPFSAFKSAIDAELAR
jgi:protein-disulfide isomerase